MAKYDYKCNDCGTSFSVEKPMSASSEETKCTECGSTDTRKVLSTFNSAKSSDSCGTKSRFT